MKKSHVRGNFHHTSEQRAVHVQSLHQPPLLLVNRPPLLLHLPRGCKQMESKGRHVMVGMQTLVNHHDHFRKVQVVHHWHQLQKKSGGKHQRRSIHKGGSTLIAVCWTGPAPSSSLLESTPVGGRLPAIGNTTAPTVLSWSAPAYPEGCRRSLHPGVVQCNVAQCAILMLGGWLHEGAN